MKVFGLGVPELLIILAVILIIFGPKNLPKLGSALGKTVKNLRDGMGIDKKKAEEDDEEVEGEAVIEEVVDQTSSKSDEPATTKKKVVVKKKLD